MTKSKSKMIKAFSEWYKSDYCCLLDMLQGIEIYDKPESVIKKLFNEAIAKRETK